MKIEIDAEEFAEKIKSGKGLSGKDGALTLTRLQYTVQRNSTKIRQINKGEFQCQEADKVKDIPRILNNQL